MKILQIFGAVVAVHLLAFIFIFASPGCQTGPRQVPTPDATVATGPGGVPAPISYSSGTTPAAAPPISYVGPPISLGDAAPTRPGSPNAAAIVPPKPVAQDVAPVTSYTVERGDSLWSIAKRNGITVGELAKANSLAVNSVLQPGRKLMIPGKAASAPLDLATAASDASSYVVVPGDTLATIARKHGITTAELRAANNRTSDMVRIGERLNLPISAKAPTTVSDTPSPARSADGAMHTVAPGEKLGTIARRYNVSVGELAAANNITDPDKVWAGQQLVIPGARGSGAARAQSTAARAASQPAAATQPAQPAADSAAPQVEAPRFEIKPPPPGEDLDAGLTPTGTEVPTIKVEEPKTNG